MERCPRNAVEPRRFPSIPRRGVYRFWFPGAGRSVRENLTATGARRYSIGSFRTAKMEIPDSLGSERQCPMVKRITASVKRASFFCLVGGGVLFLAGCSGGSSSSNTPTTPTPTPTPAPPPAPTPVTNVIIQGSIGVPPSTLVFIPFTTTATGTVGATVDWTFATSDLDV